MSRRDFDTRTVRFGGPRLCTPHMVGSYRSFDHAPIATADPLSEFGGKSVRVSSGALLSHKIEVRGVCSMGRGIPRDRECGLWGVGCDTWKDGL